MASSSGDFTFEAIRRRRMLNRLSIIRLVLQILARTPVHLPFRWGALVALKALDELTRDLIDTDRPS